MRRAARSHRKNFALPSNGPPEVACNYFKLSSWTMSSVVSSTTTHHGGPHQAVWEWWLAALIALAAAGSGAYGLWVYDVSHEGEADLWSIGYHTVPLFVL